MRRRLVLTAALAMAAAGVVSWYALGPYRDREAEQLASLVNLRPGMVVGEIGAGSGWMAVRIAKRLGSKGRLFATELEQEKAQAIRAAAARFGLSNIDVIEASEESAGLPEACCDFIYMRRVYHHLGNAGAINRGLYGALKPGGRLVVIDLDIRTPFVRHGIAAAAVVEQMTAAGFVVERPASNWSLIDYCAVFTKPAARLPGGATP